MSKCPFSQNKAKQNAQKEIKSDSLDNCADSTCGEKITGKTGLDNNQAKSCRKSK